MKKIYMKPSIELVEALGERILNNGSVVTSNGTNVGNLGDGGEGGTEDPNDPNHTIWGD
jgi:hypothetical protein